MGAERYDAQLRWRREPSRSGRGDAQLPAGEAGARMEPLNVARERQARSKENNLKPSAKVVPDVSHLGRAAIGRAQP